MSDQQYYVSLQGTMRGPADLPTLTSWVQLGEMTQDDYVWDAVNQAWLLARSMQEIAILFAPAPKLPPPLPKLASVAGGPAPQTALPEQQESPDKVLGETKELIALLGYHADQDGDLLHVGFRFDDGRTQGVFLEVAGTGRDGTHLLRVTSLCFPHKPGRRQKLNQKVCLQLLRTNYRMALVKFALVRSGDEEFVAVTGTQIFESMQLTELEALLGHVSTLADSCEQEYAKTDVF